MSVPFAAVKFVPASAVPFVVFQSTVTSRTVAADSVTVKVAAPGAPAEPSVVVTSFTLSEGIALSTARAAFTRPYPYSGCVPFT